ncbi:MAG: metallophosphoesterase family protein [Kiritimatiellae bacterium]|nr:metallophosphoesterase family protein [Kiritimatiellia bacterium]
MAADRKIAVLGDIHANLDALQAVLADAKACGATEYLCVGDVVGYNACPNECCEIVRSLGAPTVCGNHDHYSAFGESLEEFSPLAAVMVKWTRETLSAENAEWLRSLPFTEVVPGGITLVHATLDDPEAWGYVFDDLDAETSISYQKTQICFHGHTHVPVAFEMHHGRVSRLAPGTFRLEAGRKYFLNTGSVGQPRDGDPRASYCLYSPGERRVEYRRLEYDVPAAQRRIDLAGLPPRLADRLGEGR